jgi:hypothetical protein
MGRSPPWHCVWLARHLLAWASRPVAHVHHHSCCCSRTSSSSVDVVRLRFIEPASRPCTTWRTRVVSALRQAQKTGCIPRGSARHTSAPGRATADPHVAVRSVQLTLTGLVARTTPLRRASHNDLPSAAPRAAQMWPPTLAAAGTGSQPAVRRGLVSGCQHGRPRASVASRKLRVRLVPRSRLKRKNRAKR